MDGVFEVHPYSLANFSAVLVDSSMSEPSDIQARHHASYFDGYLQQLGASTLVVECNYIDHDYMEDYAEYYVKCFQPYKRKCRRLHFFSSVFGEKDLHNLLLGKASPITLDSLNDGYLGFMVVKPLPQTIFGRTCLKTYEENGSRNFPITRMYHVNLFGLPLEVRSLAFQEQDQAVAACATSALWSVFQGTGKLFQHYIPSPSEITKTATENSAQDNRAFPSCGLSSYEMARAIREVGLEPELVKAPDSYNLRSTVYAYLRAKIPMIFGVKIWNNDPTDGLSYTGAHAVAIAGYCMSSSPPQPYGLTNFRLKANAIDKIYAHDDQIGPFSRMVFDNKSITQKGKKREALSLSWHAGNGLGVPDILLIPLYKKIRIPFGTIHDEILILDSYLSLLLKAKGVLKASEGIEWDIFLTTVNELKNDILSSTSISSDAKAKVLFSEMPKYIWRATGRINGEDVVDICFDATDLEQGSMFSCGILYDHPAVGCIAGELTGIDLNLLPNITASGRSVLNRFRSG